jgi:hypothetical protein
MIASRLLKSCATPPASWPRLSNRSARAERSRAVRSSVTSRSVAAAATTVPRSSRIGQMETDARNGVPSLRIRRDSSR